MSTTKGWIATPSFQYWVEEVFVKNIPAVRPVLLIFDGHSTNIIWELTKYCERNKIGKSRRKDCRSQGSRSVRANKYLEEKTSVVKGVEGQLADWLEYQARRKILCSKKVDASRRSSERV